MKVVKVVKVVKALKTLKLPEGRLTMDMHEATDILLQTAREAATSDRTLTAWAVLALALVVLGIALGGCS